MQPPQTILLVDDSESDLFFMQEGFKRARSTHRLEEVRNGAEAIAYLKGEGDYSDRKRYPLPMIMLLDLNMPKINGFGVLSWVRSQKGLKRLTIIVISASTRVEDIEEAFDLGANSYLVKPGTIEELSSMIRSLCEWTSFNHFPVLTEAVMA